MNLLVQIRKILKILEFKNYLKILGMIKMNDKYIMHC
jgi:hypothetical protein